MIRPAREEDAGALAAIYTTYILNSTATFEEDPVDAGDIEDRLRDVKKLDLPWLVAEQQSKVIGFAYATRWNVRCAYKHSVQIAAYLDEAHTGAGIGTQLYTSLFSALRELPVNAVIAGITLPNAASQALHEKMGMVKVAHFKSVGYKFGRWLDVGYWQVLLKD